MDEIKQWLDNGREFWQGVALYKKYGPKGHLQRHFKHNGGTDYNVRKLHFVLDAIYSGMLLRVPKVENVRVEEIPQAHLIPAIIPNISNEAPKVYKKAEPEEILKLRARNGVIFRKMSYLHHQLQTVTTDNEREELAAEITELDGENKTNWIVINEFEASGKVPEAPKMVPLEDVESEAYILKRLGQLRPQISKQKNKPKRADDVKMWEAERDELVRKLEVIRSKNQ